MHLRRVCLGEVLAEVAIFAAYIANYAKYSKLDSVFNINGNKHCRRHLPALQVLFSEDRENAHHTDPEDHWSKVQRNVNLLSEATQVSQQKVIIINL